MPSGLNVNQTASITPAKIKLTRKNAEYLLINCETLLLLNEHMTMTAERISFVITDKAICAAGMKIINEEIPPTTAPRNTRFLLKSVPDTKAAARIKK